MESFGQNLGSCIGKGKVETSELASGTNICNDAFLKESFPLSDADIKFCFGSTT